MDVIPACVAALGCASLHIPGATIRYSGAEAEVHCNATGTAWTLHCRNNAWKGRQLNCSTGESGWVGSRAGWGGGSLHWTAWTLQRQLNCSTAVFFISRGRRQKEEFQSCFRSGKNERKEMKAFDEPTHLNRIELHVFV